VNGKFILDACCGGRMFWFDRKHPNALYIDKRQENKGFIRLRPSYSVEPDYIADFRDMPFPEKSFKLVVFDPPQLLTLGEKSWMRQKYGVLDKNTWQEDLTKGFNECWRVLEDYGILIFKWNESEIKLKEVLALFPETPLFGHTTSPRNNTHWLCFMKIPQEKEKP
jgi:hypothetical protein